MIEGCFYVFNQSVRFVFGRYDGGIPIRSESKAQKALDTANAYYEEHRTEITLYEAAERYLKDVMQDHFDPKKLPSISKWEAESNKLKSERQELSRRYFTLKEDVKEVERIQRSINNILREETGRHQPTHKHELDL